MNFTEFKEHVKKYIEPTGADYELYYNMSFGHSATAREGQIEDFSSGTGHGVGLRVIIEGKTGHSFTEDLSEEEAYRIVRDAVESASVTDSDWVPILYDGGKQSFGEEFVPTADKKLVDGALYIEREMLSADSRTTMTADCLVGEGGGETYIYNNKGLDVHHSSGYAYCYGSPIMEDKDEKYQEYAVGAAKTVDELDYDKIIKTATKRTADTIGAKKIATGEYPVIFQNEVFCDVLSTFCDVFSAEMVQKGLSLLGDKEGEDIASPLVTITDDPMYERSLMRSPFDDEGVKTYAKNVIEKGVLKTLLYDLKAASKAGVESTGNGHRGSYAGSIHVSPSNFYIGAGDESLQAMFGRFKKAVYITGMKGFHAGANATTRDFSIESKGFLVEDGKLGDAITGFTVSGNFYDLLKNIIGVGSDLYLDLPAGNGSIGSPSILVSSLSIAGE